MFGEKTIAFGIVRGGARPQGTQLRFRSGRAPTQLRLGSQVRECISGKELGAASVSEGRAYITSRRGFA
jgi:hypothetical protein